MSAHLNAVLGLSEGASPSAANLAWVGEPSPSVPVLFPCSTPSSGADTTDGGPDGRTGLRVPVVLEPRIPSVPIPPDLAELLGADGCTAIRDARGEDPILCAADWWTWGLPGAVCYLLTKLAAQEAAYARERACADARARYDAVTKAAAMPAAQQTTLSSQQTRAYPHWKRSCCECSSELRGARRLCMR